ncbi:MAG TPA: copper oxidase [Micromonosporaceae bacterium]|nr:copper oxidase [Micromonosporaceae bacterium]
MQIRTLIALDYLVAIVAAGLWIATAAVVAGGRKRALGNALLAGALVATAARILSAVLLAIGGWAFAEEKILISLPLLVVPAIVAAVWRSRPLPALAAACGAAAGIVVAFGVGYPVTLTNTAVVVALTVAAFLLIAGAQRAGRWRKTALVLMGVALAAGPLWSGWSSIVPERANMSAHSGHTAADMSGLRMSTSDNTKPVRRYTLTAGKLDLPMPDGRTARAWAFNGQVPGPEIRVKQGEVVEVILRNTDIDTGVTLHWHGYPVPNGDDGVAGLTQDAVVPGGEFTYRFATPKAGTFWYHTHQISHQGVKLGLYGTFVVEEAASPGLDVALPIHTLAGTRIVGSARSAASQKVDAGTPVLLRMINTDDVPHRIVAQGATWRLAAVDGTSLIGPAPVSDRSLRLAAGGRYDISFEMPAVPVQLFVDGQSVLTMGESPGERVIPVLPELDLLSYGTPVVSQNLKPDKHFIVVLDRQLRFIRGLPKYAYTINGRVWPHAPTITVRTGDLVRITVVNRDKESHPMHPHGHQVLVLSRDGVAASGSPLWMDSFDVLAGETWEVLLRADNPGLWVSHCHNLPHAAKGMMLHIAYEGVTTSYRVGGGNNPE